jgi:two-component system cell cycle sensor histidine kinase/response regulator CckA
MSDEFDIRCAPDDAAGLLAEIKRRDKIIRALMNQVERNLNNPNNDFSLLQTTFMLQEEVRQRTQELESTLHALAAAKEELQRNNIGLEKRVEERTAELSQQLHFVQQLIEAIPAPVFFKDSRLRYLGCNSAFEAMAGMTGIELIGKTPIDLFPPPQAEEFINADRELLSKPGTQMYETRIRYGDGSIHEVMFHKATFTLRDGSIGGLVGVILDITERKRLEEQVREAQKMEAMGQLAGGIAHDFNNLTTIITGYGELLRSALQDDLDLREKVEQILRASDQANSLTRQLLAFTRRQMLQPRLLDLRTVVAEMGVMLRRVVSEDIDLVVLSDPEPCPIHADAGQIQQVIMNLLINARDATPKGGRITLSVANVQLESNPRCVRLSVADTGAGMDAATKARIFEPFFTTKEIGKGTGMGLATVYGIVQQSGGQIHVESEPGKGATFDVYFHAAEGAIPETAALASGETTGGAETILVVEDQEGLRELMREILARYGYKVLPATEGREALRIAAKHEDPIHLLITDLIMPKMGGKEVAQELPRSHPETLILYMSGYANNVNELIAAGHSFIEKPFSPDTLLRRVREIFDRQAELRKSA